MSVRLGINPITWTNDDVPELGGDTPLETCLAETRLAGFAGTELGGKFPRTAAELGPILERHGLDLVSGWYDGRILEREVAAEWEAVLPHLTLLRDLGCRHVVYADTSRRAENDLYIARFVRALRYRYDSYSYALDHFLVETPHAEAVKVDGRLSDYATWLGRAEAGDFCVDGDGSWRDETQALPGRVLLDAPSEGEYRK